MNAASLEEIETVFALTGEINVIIETPRGNRSKFTYEPDYHLFLMSKILPVGMVFPYDFGMIPSTLGEDGDPLDVLVLMDEAAYPGTLVRVRLVGAIEAEQTEHGDTVRNDRLIAVASRSQNHCDIEEISALGEDLVRQVEHFFISYNELAGKQFKPIGRANAKQAARLLKEGQKRFAERPKE